MQGLCLIRNNDNNNKKIKIKKTLLFSSQKMALIYGEANRNIIKTSFTK
jgi:hypothetical protein